MSATVGVEDPWWHLSQAGRAADARTPTARPPRHVHRAQALTVTGPPVSAQLTMARYPVPDTGRDPGSAMILAVPDGGGTWGLRSEAFRRPSRMALDTSAFTHPPGGPVRLGDDALVVTEPATNGPAATSSRA